MDAVKSRFIPLCGAVSALVFTPAPAGAQDITTPAVVPELPVEIETEIPPGGSLKKVPLWKETKQLLENPLAFVCSTPDDPDTCTTTAAIERRPGFGSVMPPLDVWPPWFNVLTGQPFRLPTSDGEIDWNQPGPLFDPDQTVQDVGGTAANGFIPQTLRTVIGELIVVFEDPSGEFNCAAEWGGCLAVRNPEEGDETGDPDGRIPPDGTIVAVPGFFDGALHEFEDGDLEEVVELEVPVNEEHFIADREMAEVLGKALFWDMQVGSDGVQACGSCHFHAGVDNRIRNQLNPGTLGGFFALQVAGPNEEVGTGDFPFHKRTDPGPGEPALVSDANDVLSSMGVIFGDFSEIPTPGQMFIPGTNPPALSPDRRTTAQGGPGGVDPNAEPIPEAFTITDPVTGEEVKLRRVEPRNTPTMHSAAFNHDNFWDGRARFEFNGGSVHGFADPQFHVFVNNGTATGALHGLPHPEDAEGSLDQWEGDVPVRIKFSSLASQAVGPPLSNFEMSFDGRNWAKIGKKLLRPGVTPLANQMVATDDSVLGDFSNGALPGLDMSYQDLIRRAFVPELWAATPPGGGRVLQGSAAVCTGTDPLTGFPTPAGCDPFDGYVLTITGGNIGGPGGADRFTQMEANFSLFFGLAVQAYEQLLIPDDTPWDRMNDANPLLGNAVAQPGEQGTLPPETIRELVTGSPTGTLNMVDGVDADVIFGFDIFAGGNLTAVLPEGSARNPEGFGSNPFLRTGRCMLCHAGPEQTDHTVNADHGLKIGGTEFEFPTPQTAPEPTGISKMVTGLSLAEEVEEPAQDGVEVENRNFAILDDPNTPWNDAQVGSPRGVAFQDNGIYNIGVRPTAEDIARGGDDPFGWPLSLAALAMKNLGGPDYEPCDNPLEASFQDCALPTFDPDAEGFGLFEETGADQRINPGLEMEPANPLLPPYIAEFANNLPAGELSPLIDELAFAPNTVGALPDAFGPFGDAVQPSAEFGEILFGADLHCGVFDPDTFGNEPPNFGWGPLCPNSQTGVPVNFDPPRQGTEPFENRLARDGAIKVPQLRNVELTGPYFRTGSYLTLRQVVDFYDRGGDFPITNAEDRDPNLIDMDVHAFSFGATTGLPAQFQDAVPDAVSLYDAMPDTDQPNTPEPASSTPEQAKVALVKFMLALTDERVRNEGAPFDRPEIFVPLDGTAPDNTFGRAGLEAGSTGECADFLAGLDANPTGPDDAAAAVAGPGPCFQQLPAIGEGGRSAAGLPPLSNFLNVASVEQDGVCDHFDSGNADCGDSPPVPPEPAVVQGFQVALGLDFSITQGLQLGPRFTTPRNFRSARKPGTRLSVDAQALVRDDQGAAEVSATWTPGAGVRVSPRQGPKATLEISGCNRQTSVNVTSSQGSRQLQIATICERGTIQAQITQ